MNYKETYNIAVCLSGQPRTWKTAKDNILYYFNLEDRNFKDKKIKVDYFIHTWDTNSYRSTSKIPVISGTHERLDSKEEFDIIEAFKPKKIIYEKYIPENFIHAWSALFYSFMKSIFLKKEYELENDFYYDIVIKTRFDLNFQQMVFDPKNYLTGGKFIVHQVEPFSAYTTSPHYSRFSKEFNRICFDDVFFYADSFTMDTISNIYKWYVKICDKEVIRHHNNQIVENPERFLGPGTLLYKYLVDWGIHPSGQNVIHYYVVRKEAQDRGLDSLNNWQEILKISRDFYGETYGKV